MKTLLIDINSITPLFTKGFLFGVGRSTYELIKALDNLEDIPFKIILYSQNTKGIGVKNLNTKFKTMHLWFPNRPKYNKIRDFFRLRKLISGYDLYHIPHNTDKTDDIRNTIFTIHDLIVMHYPEMWGLTDKDREEFKYIAKNCKSIVTCSEASKKDIVHFWNVPEQKVKVIYWGLDREKCKPNPNDTLFKSIPGIRNGFFFCASCNHERKNTPLLLGAFRKYIEKGGKHQLVLLSPSTKDIDDYKDLIDSNQLIIVRGIDDSMLISLYRNAVASIVVSLYEGFGFPVLESLGCHTQVICARNSSLTEVGGNVVDYLEDLSVESLASKLSSYDFIDKQYRIDKNKVERHLSKFTWDKCAKEYVKFWAQLLNK